MTFQRVTSLVCATVATAIMLMLLALNFPLSGTMTTHATLGEDSKIISKFGPEVRVRMQGDYQEIIDSPVYFDYRFMPWFNSARIELVYRESGRTLTGLGLQNGPEFSYDVRREFESIDVGDGFRRVSFDVSTDELYTHRNVTRFLIETKPVDDKGGTFDLYSLTVQLWR